MSKVDQIRALREANFERVQKLAKQPIAKTKPKASPVKAEVIKALRTEVEKVNNAKKKKSVINKGEPLLTESSKGSASERQKKWREKNKDLNRSRSREGMRQKRQGKK